MYARVTVVQGSPDRIEQGIDSFESAVLPAAKCVDGYKAAFLLADRKTGKGIRHHPCGRAKRPGAGELKR